MWQTYYQPTTTSEALALLAEHGERARVIAGGTDLILELERGVRSQRTLVDITRIPGLAGIELDEAQGEITLGPLVTHNDVVASPLLVERAFPLARACWEVGAPQIRNRGTVAGNLITASPANDTITPLWALDGAVTLVSQQRGRATPAVRPVLQGRPPHRAGAGRDAGRDPSAGASPNGTRPVHQAGAAAGTGDLAWSTCAVVLDFDGDLITAARITLGSVAPTIVRAREAEASLVGRPLSDTGMHHAAELAVQAAHPIDDVRATADYRASMVGVLVERALRQLRAGTERAGWPARPVLLRGAGGRWQVAGGSGSGRWQWQLSERSTCTFRPATCNPHHLHPQRPGNHTGRRRRQDAAARAARGRRHARRQGRLRRGRVWRLHGLARRRGGDGLPGAGRARPGLRCRHDRGPGAPTGNYTRCRPPLSPRAQCSAAIARRA